MKARVKATGEVFEIASYATIPMECCDSFGEPLRFCFDDVEILSEENDLKESKAPDYWTKLEHQYAGMAMQGILTNPIGFENIRARGTNIQIETALLASEFAHALIQKLKEKEERKRPKHECRCLYNGPDAKRDSETKRDFVNRKTEDAYKMAGIISDETD